MDIRNNRKVTTTRS